MTEKGVENEGKGEVALEGRSQSAKEKERTRGKGLVTGMEGTARP